MNREEKIRALAELDGLKKVLGSDLDYTIPRYLTSYDAIIPLIQKQPENIIDEFLDCLCVETEGEPMSLHVNFPQLVSMWKATPEQLADALIRAVGKWRE